MFGGGANKSVLMALSLCIGGLIGIRLCENMQYPCNVWIYPSA